jgi:hypothetical protein
MSASHLSHDAVPANPILRAAMAFVHGLVRPRLSMQAEALALRHRRAVYQRFGSRPNHQPWYDSPHGFAIHALVRKEEPCTSHRTSAA